MPFATKKGGHREVCRPFCFQAYPKDRLFRLIVGSVGGLAFEGMEELIDVAPGQFVIDAVIPGSCVGRHMSRAEDEVPERELSGEILVIGFTAIGVMPMVKLRGSDQPGERSKPDIDVGVHG